MAGLLDYIGGVLPQGFRDDLKGAGDYLWQLDRLTAQNPFTGGNSFPMPGSHTPGWGTDILNMLGKLDKATGSSVIGNLVTPTLPQPAPTPNGPSGEGDMADWYKGASGPAASKFGAGASGASGGIFQPIAQPSWQQTPQAAASSFDMPSSSYAWGNVNVPVFGQAENPAIPPNATPTEGRSNVAIPAAAASPSAPAVNTNPAMEFLSAIRPGFVGRYESRKTQQQNAQNLSTFFQGKGMDPNQANAMAAVAAQNPKIMEEFFKQPATIEGALARDMAFGTGGGAARGSGNATQQYYDHLSKKTQAEELAKKRADAESGRETLRLSLPSFEAEARDHIRQVEQLVNHQGRKGNVWWHGKGSSFLPDSSIPGNTAAGDAVNLMNQIKGGAFLEAFKALKGGGPITEIEGKKATDAMNRMNRSTSEKEFNDAAAEYVGAIRRGLDKLHAEAGVAPPNNYRGRDGWSVVPMPGSSAPVRIRQVQ